jgi:hypothetical protein
VTECADVHKEVCNIEKVRPRQVNRPVVKKWCTKKSSQLGNELPTA